MKKNLAGNEKGFTLIELIVVIVILGILAAVAVPKYQDLTSEARNAAAEGVLAAARGGATMNFAKNLAGGAVSPVTDDASGGTRLSALIDTDYTKTAGTGEVSLTISGKTYTIEVVTSENTTTAPTPALLGKKSGAWGN